MTPDEGHAPPATMDHTLSLPTVATPLPPLTVVHDAVGAEADHLLNVYHGYPVTSPSKISRSPSVITPPSTRPATAHGERVSTGRLTPVPVPDGFGHGPADHDPPAPALVPGGSQGRGGRVTVLGELRAHPLRLSAILMASVPVGVLIAQLLGASPLYHPGGSPYGPPAAPSPSSGSTAPPRDHTTPLNRAVPHTPRSPRHVAPVQPAPRTSHSASHVPSTTPSHSTHPRSPRPTPSKSHSHDPDPTPTGTHTRSDEPSAPASDPAPASPPDSTPTTSHPEVSPS